MSASSSGTAKKIKQLLICWKKKLNKKYIDGNELTTF